LTVTATITEVPEQAVRRADRSERLMPWALLSPALVIAIVFFGIPMLVMLRMSLNEHAPQRLYVPGFTFRHYALLLTEERFVNAIWTTVKLSLLSSLATLVIGYAFALLVWLKPTRWRLAFIGLALTPLLISEISIIFGWWMFFPRNGLLSFALTSAGVLSDKISLMYTEFAAFVGLIYVTLPFCFFILLSIFDAIDRRLIEASGDLGARPITTFFEVLLPLTRTGILVAFAQSFIWAMGTYATPSALGPDTLWTIGYLIQEQMLGKSNWPLAAAFSMILVVAVAVVMVLIQSLNARRTSFHA
jgi:ABC-type spermidine/putrescine transport system permease subunit I